MVSVGNGIESEQEQTNKVNQAAADAADEYFNGLGRERMSLMNLGGGGGPGDMLTSPVAGAAQQGFGSQAGGTGGRDLLD